MSAEGVLLSKWRSMIGRCYGNNTKPTQYQRNGIKICDEWMGENGFQNFLQWSLSHGYAPGLYIDRIDTHGDYCPENCRYVTQKENNRNRKDTVYVEYHGNKVKLCELCEEFGISRTRVNYRLKRGIPIDDLPDKREKKERKGAGEKAKMKKVVSNGFLTARRKVGLTQKEVADSLGVRQAAVCFWESGRTVPRLPMLLRLAELYGCSVDELLADGKEVRQ